MSNYDHYTDMTYAYDPNAQLPGGPMQPQFQNYDQYYGNFPAATGEMQTGAGQVNSSPAGYYGEPNMAGSMADSSDPYANEPPLLEELEINLDQIRQKIWAVLTFRSLNDHRNILHDPDLAGPLVILMTFGFLLLLKGKIQFGYIYGLGTLGCFIIYFVVYLMAPRNISFMCTVSVLGYCLLPMVMLSGLSILVTLKATLAGSIFSILSVLWCATVASNLLVTAIEMSSNRLLIAYPCGLFYTVFALLTVF